MVAILKLTDQQKRHGYFADPASPADFLPRVGRSVVSADWCDDGTRDMILTRPVIYVDPTGEKWIAEAGKRVNGLSSPRILWPVMNPYQPRARNASVIHDVFCVKREVSWLKSAWCFYHAMRAGGLDPVRSGIRWFGVVAFGWWRRFFI